MLTEATIHQVSISNGLRWKFIETKRINFTVDGLVGLRLDINQNAPLPTFVSLEPRINFDINDQSSLTLRIGAGLNLTGYKEYLINHSIGYQFSF